MPTPARIARDMVEQMRIRCRMWGIRMGEVELEEGNMLTNKRVGELIPQADVILVDNKVFEESRLSFPHTPLISSADDVLVNEALQLKFLDLKEGAIVISLSPFIERAHYRMQCTRNIIISNSQTHAFISG